MLDMQRANNITSDGYVLRVPSNTHYVFYSENTSLVRIDLTSMAGSQPVIAVDTKKEYDELEVGMLGSKEHVWKAPYRSDWAICALIHQGRSNSQKTRDVFFIVYSITSLSNFFEFTIQFFSGGNSVGSYSIQRKTIQKSIDFFHWQMR